MPAKLRIISESSKYYREMIHPAVFFCQFEQNGEFFLSLRILFSSGHQLDITTHPVPHQPLLISVFRWPPVVLLHKCHYFVVSGLPAFGLGHRRLYGRCAQNYKKIGFKIIQKRIFYFNTNDHKLSIKFCCAQRKILNSLEQGWQGTGTCYI